jgi:DNA-directed RNA polymerase subunit beta'
MNRLRVAASSRDAALRAQQRDFQASLIAPRSAAEEHAAELRRPVEDDIGNDPLGDVVGETHGSDADAGDYLQKSDS